MTTGEKLQRNETNLQQHRTVLVNLSAAQRVEELMMEQKLQAEKFGICYCESVCNFHIMHTCDVKHGMTQKRPKARSDPSLPGK